MGGLPGLEGKIFFLKILRQNVDSNSPLAGVPVGGGRLHLQAALHGRGAHPALVGFRDSVLLNLFIFVKLTDADKLPENFYILSFLGRISTCSVTQSCCSFGNKFL